MDLDVLKGEIAAIEDAIEDELEFSTFDEDEDEIPEIRIENAKTKIGPS